ncbi:MAG: SWI/SNF complex component snf12 [Icmadophila ericetorum]|nr:SWI/SNF complex component snf12 [Icmadophila ericetorum]
MNAGRYAHQQQYPQRSPHGSSSRRGPGPIVGSHNPSAPSPAQLLAQRNAAMENDNAKRKAKKPTDKNIPEGVEDIVIGDGVQQYRNLREVERRLDALMVRKRLDLQSRRPQRHERTKTLRIWISNTAENQPWQGTELGESAFDFSTGTEATYRVKVEGRLLDDEKSEDQDDELDGKEEDTNGDEAKDGDATNHDGQPAIAKSVKSASTQARKRFSHFFKSITVEFDRNKNLQPDIANQIEWKKQIPPNVPNADFDWLEFERKSDENINCTINLFRDEDKHKVSKDLAEILDSDEETRSGIVMGIWEYVKAMNLQQDEEKRLVQCDERLRAIFHCETFYFPLLPDLIINHISALPPIKLPYTIRVDPDYHAAPTQTIYDVLVAVEDPLRAKTFSIIQNPTYPATLRQIASLDEQLAATVQAINHSKAKHAFFSAMSKDPATFVRRWTSSQKRDLEVILGEATRGGGEDGVGEEFRRGGKNGVWGTEIVRESVGLMVSHKR